MANCRKCVVLEVCRRRSAVYPKQRRRSLLELCNQRMQQIATSQRRAKVPDILSLHPRRCSHYIFLTFCGHRARGGLSANCPPGIRSDGPRHWPVVVPFESPGRQNVCFGDVEPHVALERRNACVLDQLQLHRKAAFHARAFAGIRLDRKLRP